MRPAKRSSTTPHPMTSCSVARRTGSRRPRPCCCHSTMLYFQCYLRYTRFEAKVFLTEALRYFDGVSHRVMVDNT